MGWEKQSPRKSHTPTRLDLIFRSQFRRKQEAEGVHKKRMEVAIQKGSGMLGLEFERQPYSQDVFVRCIEERAQPDIIHRLKVGDKIISLNGAIYTKSRNLCQAIATAKEGDQLLFEIERPAQASANKKSKGARESPRTFDLKMSLLNPEAAEVHSPPKASNNKNSKGAGVDLKMSLLNTETAEVHSPPKSIQKKYLKVTIQKGSGMLGLEFERQPKSKDIFIRFIEERAQLDIIRHFKVGDKIISLNGAIYTKSRDLCQAIANAKEGGRLQFEIERPTQVKTLSATKIQSSWRAKRLRTLYRFTREVKTLSVTKIQASWRAKRVRELYRFTREVKTLSATKIQASWRAKRVRTSCRFTRKPTLQRQMESEKFEKDKALWEFQLKEVQKAEAEAQANYREEIRELLNCPENHGLEYVLNPSGHACNRCDKQKLESRGCLQCNFFVCSTCEEDQELVLVLKAQEW